MAEQAIWANSGAERLVRVKEAAATLSLSRSKVYELADSGLLPTVRVGKAVLIRAVDLEEFIRSLPSAPLQRDELQRTGKKLAPKTQSSVRTEVVATAQRRATERRTRAANGDGYIGHEGPSLVIAGQVVYKHYFYDYFGWKTVLGQLTWARQRFRPRGKTYLNALREVERFKHRLMNRRAGSHGLPDTLVACAHAFVNEKLRSKRIGDESARTYRTLVNAIEAEFGQLPVHVSDDLERWRGFLLGFRETHSEVTSLGFEGFCRSLANWLHAYGLWHQNPVEIVTMTFPRLAVVKPKTDSRTLLLEQIDEFVWATNGHPDQAELLFPLVVGCRHGQHLSVLVGDIDWTRGVVRLDKQLNEESIAVEPKERLSEKRLIKLPAAYFARVLCPYRDRTEKLLGRKLEQHEPLFGELVVGTDGNVCRRPWKEAKSLERLRLFQRERGILETDVHTHRHSTKTIAAFVGVEDKIGRYLGHAQPGTTGGYGRTNVVTMSNIPARWRVTRSVLACGVALDKYLSVLIAVSEHLLPLPVPADVQARVDLINRDLETTQEQDAA